MELEKLHQLETFGLSGRFSVKLKHTLLTKVCIHLFKKHTGHEIQLLLTGVRVVTVKTLKTSRKLR